MVNKILKFYDIFSGIEVLIKHEFGQNILEMWASHSIIQVLHFRQRYMPLYLCK
jgi:hypothetical protein